MPKISVVMSVYNGAADLAPTIDSILGQTESDFELIVVDDGSTDATPSILASYSDSRLRVIAQSNAGLTRALIRGCAEARGTLIARHDCGDRSHSERFAKQLALFADDVVLVATTTRFVTSEGELLYFGRGDGDEIRRSVLHDGAEKIHGVPHHGSVMFRRDAYLAAGGYREPFRVAQDLDLWVRLAARGRFVIAQEELYEATIHPSAISSVNRDAQVATTEIIVALRDGGDEATLLAKAANVPRRNPSAAQHAAALYFIGRCLRAQKTASARRYFAEAIRRNPFHWRAWASLLSGR